jgi:hypothetical protein
MERNSNKINFFHFDRYFTLQNGEHLIKPNDASDTFYFLINGQLRVHEKEGDSLIKLGM